MKMKTNMSTAALTGLRDYLFGTLSPADMKWLAGQLTEYTEKEEHTPVRYTMEEINAMLDAAEADFEDGRFIDDDDAWDDLYEEFDLEKKKTTELAEAV